MLPYRLIPFIFLSDTPSLPRPPPPRPSLACPLSYMWHGCLLLPVTSQAVRWPLHFWCWQAKLESRRPMCACVHERAQTHTHAHTLGSREHHPRRRRVSKWPNTGCLMSVCFASSLFSLHLYLRSPSLYLCLSFIPVFLLLLCIDIYISVFLGCCFSLCLRSISMYFFSCYFPFPPVLLYFTFFKILLFCVVFFS